MASLESLRLIPSQGLYPGEKSGVNSRRDLTPYRKGQPDISPLSQGPRSTLPPQHSKDNKPGYPKEKTCYSVKLTTSLMVKNGIALTTKSK